MKWNLSRYCLAFSTVFVLFYFIVWHYILRACWNQNHQRYFKFPHHIILPLIPQVKEVNCAKVISDDFDEVNKALEIMSSMRHKAPIKNSAFYINQTMDCQEFIRNRGYISHYVTGEEKLFPISFSILVYKDIERVERLLRAIYRPQNVMCIHVDRKARKDFRDAIAAIASCFSNVFLSSRSIFVQWGEFEVVEAETICMQDLLKYKKWKYFINLTGQEFPLKTNLQLVQILKEYRGTNDIQGSVKRRNVYRTQPKEPAPHGILLTKGSVHIVASRGFVRFVCTDRRATDFLHWLNGTYIPDETFFSSLNHSPHLGVPGSFNGSLDDLESKTSLARHKLWYPAECTGRWQRAICIFNVGDLPRMVKAPQLFANKFEQDFGYLTYDCLEEWHRNRTRDEYNGLYAFNSQLYRGLPHVIQRSHIQGSAP